MENSTSIHKDSKLHSLKIEKSSIILDIKSLLIQNRSPPPPLWELDLALEINSWKEGRVIELKFVMGHVSSLYCYHIKEQIIFFLNWQFCQKTFQICWINSEYGVVQIAQSCFTQQVSPNNVSPNIMFHPTLHLTQITFHPTHGSPKYTKVVYIRTQLIFYSSTAQLRGIKKIGWNS